MSAIFNSSRRSDEANLEHRLLRDKKTAAEATVFFMRSVSLSKHFDKCTELFISSCQHVFFRQLKIPLLISANHSDDDQQGDLAYMAAFH